MPNLTKAQLQARLRENNIEFDPKLKVEELKNLLRNNNLYGRGRKRAPQQQEQEPAQINIENELPINLVEMIEPGTYIVSGLITLLIKDKGYTTKDFSEEYTVKDDAESKDDILDKVGEIYVEKNYHKENSPVEIICYRNTRFDPKEDIDLRTVRNREQHVKLQYKMLPDDLKVNNNKGQCVLDYIMTEACSFFSKYSRKELINELTETATEEEKDFLEKGVSTNHILNWAKYKKYISVWALDPFGKVFESYCPPSGTKVKVCLVFIVNNNHCYPILDKELKASIAQAKRIKFNTIALNVGNEESAFITTDEAIKTIDNLTKTEKIIHVGTDDLSAVLKVFVAKTGYIPTSILSNASFIIAFEHPLTNQIILASEDYLERKDICDKLFEETKYIGLRFNNQTWAQIFDAYTEFKIGKIPTSFYSPSSLMIREEYPISGVLSITREVTEEEKQNIQSFDITRCYSSCLLDNENDFSIETAFDDIEPFESEKNEKLPVGKAYIEKNFNLGAIKFNHGFYPSFFVDYCLKEKAIQLTDIKYIQKSARVLKANTFKEMANELIEKFPKMSKRIINSGIGNWGRRFSKESSVAITDSWEVALGMMKEDLNISFTSIGNEFYFLRKESKEPLYSGHISLREHIVCMGHIKLNELQKQLQGPNSEMIAFNTDSVKVINPNPDFKPVDKALAKPGDICIEQSINLRGQINLRERKQYIHNLLNYKDVTCQSYHDDSTPEQEHGFIANAAPGCGKSYLLKSLYNSAEDKTKEIKLAWTKTAAKNIQGETLDHFFLQDQNKKEWIKKALKYKTFYIDEYTIIPCFWWSIFHEIKRTNPKIKFKIFGDYKQLHAQDYEGSKLWFDYFKSELLYFLTDGFYKELEYRKEAARYDTELKNKLDNFCEERTLKAFESSGLRMFGPEECLFTITKTPLLRQKVNEKWVSVLSKGQETKQCGNMNIWKGMYLISFSNGKEIINSTRYLITDITPKDITLKTDDNEELTVSYSEVANNCKYGYADTIMRVISRTIKGKFNIMEADKMSWNELYVALSRATTTSDIGIKINTKKYEYAVPPKMEIVNPLHKIIDYCVYQRTDGIKIYTGITNDFERRKKEHEESPVSEAVKKWEEEARRNNRKIEMNIIETYKISNEKQIEKREQEVIAKVPPEICMNTKGKQKAAVEKATTKIERVEINYERFKITNDEKEKRLRIRWREDNKEKSKTFRYVNITLEEAMQEAEAFRAELVKINFK